jgi:hypothetical protein
MKRLSKRISLFSPRSQIAAKCNASFYKVDINRQKCQYLTYEENEEN